MNKRATDLIGGRGVSLVKNAYAEHLQWIARDDVPDDGYDLNIEVPPTESRSTERFLVQVKTSERITPLKSGHWSVAINRSTCQKYRNSGLVVFLFKVELATREMRWLNLSESLRHRPGQVTFSLGPSNRLDANSCPVFGEILRRAIDAHVDSLRSPVDALNYRARQLENLDPRFQVSADIVGGVQRVTLTPKFGTNPKFTVTPKTRADARKMQKAVNYGANAEVALRSFSIEGSSILGNGGGQDAILKVQSAPKSLRLSITWHDCGNPSGIELNAHAARGNRGFELRSADNDFPFRFTFRGRQNSRQSSLTVQMIYEQWNGRTLSGLTIIDR